MTTHTIISFVNPDALTQATPEQVAAIRRLCWDSCLRVIVGPATFDLPPSYLTFRQEFGRDKSDIYGGIAPDGAVST